MCKGVLRSWEMKKGVARLWGHVRMCKSMVICPSLVRQQEGVWLLGGQRGRDEMCVPGGREES